MMLANGDKIGPYTIRDSAGQGGMATVYKAWHEGLHRLEALKVPKGAGSSDPDSAFIQRLLTEARVSAGLHHPNIVAIHGISEPNAPIPYFAMDWIEGRDLAKIMAEKRTFSLDETTAILEKVAVALDYAHQKNVVHRDIKPANILITESDGELVPHVVDFGISRAAEDEDGATKLTKSGMIVGTPEYMSPEQAGSGDPVDYRTDIYSLAVVAFEMLCGSPPFTAGDGVSRLSILIAHVRDVAPLYKKIPNFPREAGDVLLRALSKSPQERQQSCVEFVRQLKEAGQSSELFSSDQAYERTPFDATRFQSSDDATIAVRPSSVARTVPAQTPGAETALTSAEPQYSLQARLAAAQVATPAPEPVPPATPKTKVLESAPAAAPPPAALSPNPPSTATRSSSRIAMLAGVGGVIIGALLVSTISQRGSQGGKPAPVAAPTVLATPMAASAPTGSSSSGATSTGKGKLSLRKVQKKVTREIEFETVTRRSDTRPAGSTYVEQEGKKGVREVTLSITYQGDKEVLRRVMSNQVTVQPVLKKVVLGTRTVSEAPRPRVRPRPVRSSTTERRERRRVAEPQRRVNRRPAPRVKKRRPVREAPLPP